MDQELISKKELLALTGISYGQLYRWKRERLLPEEWFIKQSSFTGQETYFPRMPVLERINVIKEMKDAHTLEDIAEFVTPSIGGAVSLRRLFETVDVEAAYRDILTKQLPSAWPGQGDQLSFSEAVFIGAIGSVARNGVIDSGRAAALALKSRELAGRWHGGSMGCAIIAATASEGGHEGRSLHLMMSGSGMPVYFSASLEVIGQLPLETVSASIKRSQIEQKAKARINVETPAAPGPAGGNVAPREGQ
jgi:hypothetical protein